MAVFPAERQVDDPDGRAAPSRCSLPTPRHRTSQKSGLPGLAEAEAAGNHTEDDRAHVPVNTDVARRRRLVLWNISRYHSRSGGAHATAASGQSRSLQYLTLAVSRSHVIADHMADRATGSSKLVILPPTLLTGETKDRFDDDQLVPDDRGSYEGPPPACRQIVIRLADAAEAARGKVHARGTGPTVVCRHEHPPVREPRPSGLHCALASRIGRSAGVTVTGMHVQPRYCS